MGCSFFDFVEYFLEIKDNDKLKDHHWKSLDYQCQPCNIGYNFVGFQESMDEDIRFVMHEIFVNEADNFTFSSVYKNHLGTDSELFDLKESQAAQLKDHFKKEFEMFNYH